MVLKWEVTAIWAKLNPGTVTMMEGRQRMMIAATMITCMKNHQI